MTVIRTIILISLDVCLLIEANIILKIEILPNLECEQKQTDHKKQSRMG